jgi:hypothetical protein
MLVPMDLEAELDVVAGAAATFAGDGETLSAVLATEPSPGQRTYLCAFDGPGARKWLALDASGTPVTSRDRVREAIAIAAACEVAEEAIGAAETPRVASPDYLDRLGAGKAPTLAAGLGDAVAVADGLADEIEAQYKLSLT